MRDWIQSSISWASQPTERAPSRIGRGKSPSAMPW
jgi:hypothetical protein